MLRRRRSPDDPLAHLDPGAVSPRFAPAVSEALAVRQRFGAVLAGVRDGPVRERLAETAPRIDASVLAVWEAAGRATEIERTVAALDPDRVTDDYKRAKRAGGDPALTSALAARFASVQRLLNALDDTGQRLELLEARLGAAVAVAAEVALGAAETTGAEALDAELDHVVGELGALRQALDDLG